MENTMTYNSDIKIKEWFNAATINDIPADGGMAVLYEGQQIALFNFSETGQWYAMENVCPHKQQNCLSRGIIGTIGDEPKVACPFHKKAFSLKTGDCLTGEDYKVKVFPVKLDGENILIGIPECR